MNDMTVAKLRAPDTEQELLSLIPELRAFARALTRNATEADDLVQDTLTRAIASFDSYVPGTRMRAWLFTIMRNAFYSRRRKAVRETTGATDCIAGQPQVEPSQEWSMTYIEVMRALTGLPVHYRETLVLVTMLGESYEVASQILGCSIGTVKSRINRGRLMLLDRLGSSLF